MENFFAYQRDARPPCKYGRKCFQKNKDHLDKYKHPPTKENVKIEMEKKSKKRDSKGRVRSSNPRLGESSSANNGSNANRELNNVEEINDMEVPEQLNVATIESEASSSPSTNNQHLSNEYVVPTTRRHVQQQQLLLTNSLEDCCNGDDSIVPSTPTLFTPRRLDGETVSSPHVPSNNQVYRFTFVGESQASQVSDLNDGEQPSSSEQAVICEDPAVWNSKITELFLVGKMPKEFFDFWSFCKKLCPSHPKDAFLSVGLKLVGPYDVLAGLMNDFNANDVEKTVLHWRYYYDPPEFQTILASTDSQFHIGYFRDQPLEMPVFIASNDSDKNCIIHKLGKSLFHSIRRHLQTINGKAAHTLKNKIYAYEQKIVGDTLVEGRRVCAVTKTFHKAGIVVPYDSKTDVGYRPLSESDRVLRSTLKLIREASENKKIDAMDKLQTFINYANIASDECDFGTGLELGIDIFCDGNPELHRICKQLLVTAYNLLRRPQFVTIIKAHLTNRRNGQNMSIL